MAIVLQQCERRNAKHREERAMESESENHRITSRDSALPAQSFSPERWIRIEELRGAVWPPRTDADGVPPFKYPFAPSRKRIESAGWTRQVTVRELAISKDIAGVEMKNLE
jgi:oxalate decarboxylase